MNEKWKDMIEKAFSDAVNLEHAAFYFYLSMGAYMDTSNIALLNIRDMFYKESDEELEHAKALIKFMNQRGLKWTRMNIETPDPTNWTVPEVFQKSTAFERKVLQNFLIIQKYANDANDFETTQFIDKFVQKQIKEVKEHSDREKSALRCGKPFEEFMLDQSYKNFKKDK